MQIMERLSEIDENIKTVGNKQILKKDRERGGGKNGEGENRVREEKIIRINTIKNNCSLHSTEAKGNGEKIE